MLKLGSLVWATVLLVNAVAVLNEERFLSPSKSARSERPCMLTGCVIVGWGRASEGYEQQSSVKRQIIQLIAAVRTLMRSKAGDLCFLLLTCLVPLIIINIFIIVYEIFLG